MRGRVMMAALAATGALLSGAATAGGVSPASVDTPDGSHFETRATCATDSATMYWDTPPASPSVGPSLGFGVNFNASLGGTTRAWLSNPYNLGGSYVVSHRVGGKLVQRVAQVLVADLHGEGGYRLLAGTGAPPWPNPAVDLSRTIECPDYAALPATVFVPLAQRRVLDTRPGSAVGYQGERPAAGATVAVDLGDLPAGAVAAVVTVTQTEATGPGYVQVLPAGSGDTGAWSNLNSDGPGRIVANTAVVPLGANGDLAVFTQA